MRISELIVMLNKAQDEHGDIDVALGQVYWDADEQRVCNELKSEISLDISNNYAFDTEYWARNYDEDAAPFEAYPFVDTWGLDESEVNDLFHTGEHCLVIGYQEGNLFVCNDAAEQYKLRKQAYQEFLNEEEKKQEARMAAARASQDSKGGL